MRIRTVADPPSKGPDNSETRERKFYRQGWYDIDDKGEMIVSKVTGLGKSAGKGIPVARVVYAGHDSQGREHAAVWVDAEQGRAVTGFLEAMNVYKDRLKSRKKSTAPTVSVEASVTKSSTKPKSQQAIFDGLHSTAKEAASQGGKTLTKKEYNDLWEQAGVIHAQSTASWRTKPVV